MTESYSYCPTDNAINGTAKAESKLHGTVLTAEYELRQLGVACTKFLAEPIIFSGVWSPSSITQLEDIQLNVRFGNLLPTLSMCLYSSVSKSIDRPLLHLTLCRGRRTGIWNGTSLYRHLLACMPLLSTPV